MPCSVILGVLQKSQHGRRCHWQWSHEFMQTLPRISTIYLSRPATDDGGEPQQLKSRVRQKHREREPEVAVQEGKEGMNAAGSIRLAFEALSNLFTRNLFSRDVNTDGCDGQTLLIGLCRRRRRLTMRRNSQSVRPKERDYGYCDKPACFALINFVRPIDPSHHSLNVSLKLRCRCTNIQ